MDILTQTISLLFRHRQTEIGRFGQDIDHIQRKQLHALLSTARKTEWGLKYDYKSIRSYSDFCQRLPLQTYEAVCHPNDKRRKEYSLAFGGAVVR